MSLFTDLFLYDIMLPILPSVLRDRVSIPRAHVQAYTSGLLATYAAASVLLSVPVGCLAHKAGSRHSKYIYGAVLLYASVVLTAFGQSIPILVLARLLQGASAAIVWTVGFAMVHDVIGPEMTGQVIGTTGAVSGGPSLFYIVVAFLVGILNATVPTEAEFSFGFSPSEVGLLFVAFFFPNLALGRAAGKAIDRYGTKSVATVGYALLVPCLMLLGLPSLKLISGLSNTVLFGIALFLNGSCLAMVGSTSFVEASDIIRVYAAANPTIFGADVPYAQLYSLNSLFSFAGLTAGPVLGGILRINYGYCAMNFILGALSSVASIAAFFVMGKRNP
ncbi:major facilitator superfamily protein [Hirsutella rhossiliensis]